MSQAGPIYHRSRTVSDRLRTTLSCSSQTRLRNSVALPNITIQSLVIFPETA